MGKDKYYSRVEDLINHVDKNHTDISVPRKLPRHLLTSKNAFNVARFPMDYATIVQEVQDYDHDDARELRGAVSKWAFSFSDADKRMEIWSEGWKEAYDIGKRKNEHISLTDERDNKTRTHKQNSINIPKQNEKTVNKTRIEASNEKSKTSEQRSSDKTLERAANNLNINHDKDSDKGKRSHRDEMQVQKNKKQKTSEVDDLCDYDDDVEIGEEVNIDKRIGVGQSGEAAVRVVRTGGVDKNVEGADKNVEGVDRNVKDVVLWSGSVGDQDGNTQRSRIAEGNGQLMVRLEDSSVSVDAGGDARIVCGATDQPDYSSTSSSSSSSTCSSSCTSRSSRPSSSQALQNRAAKLLAQGVMPLCPPARRLWTRNLDIEINETNISWPPTNWKELSPENRLFAMEQVALTLERKNSAEFPVISKKLLCDKYAFLMLEGQDKPLVNNVESEKVPDKIRQYNYSFLKGVAKGEILDSRQAWSIVKTLEHADRWTDTDEIVKILEDGGVHVKI